MLTTSTFNRARTGCCLFSNASRLSKVVAWKYLSPHSVHTSASTSSTMYSCCWNQWERLTFLDRVSPPQNSHCIIVPRLRIRWWWLSSLPLGTGKRRACCDLKEMDLQYDTEFPLCRASFSFRGTLSEWRSRHQRARIRHLSSLLCMWGQIIVALYDSLLNCAKNTHDVSRSKSSCCDCCTLWPNMQCVMDPMARTVLARI